MSEEATAAAPEDATAEAPPEPVSSIQDSHLEVVMDLPVTIALEVGRTRLSLRDLLQVSPGSVVKLDRNASEPMDMRVNGKLVARGEVVVVGQQYGIRVSEVVTPEQRLSSVK